MYTRVVQKLVEKLCLKHKLSQKDEHGCSNREQFGAIFVTRLSSQYPIFVSTGIQVWGAWLSRCSMGRVRGRGEGWSPELPGVLLQGWRRREASSQELL